MTDAAGTPFILVVDDEPDQMRGVVPAGLADRAASEVLHPREVEIEHLEKADLVLVDYRLDNWEERDALGSIALQPTTGMALASVLREHVDRSRPNSLTGFAIHSHLDDMRGRLPAASAQHVVARLNNLEWVFPKDDDRRYDQMVLLAEAIRLVPRTWPDSESDTTSKVRELLGMKEEADWFDRSWREVRECQPPVNELAGGGHGVLFVRWLLQQVLPYPCFLWESHWVAARLRITPEALQKVCESESDLSRDLKAMRYSGSLAGFLGDRWWRGALEDYVWGATGGRSGDAEQLRKSLAERAGTELDPIEASPPVVCLNPNLSPSGEFSSPSAALRIRPDHWPAFADAAWAKLETVQEEPGLLAMVDPLDLGRINQDNEAE